MRKTGNFNGQGGSVITAAALLALTVGGCSSVSSVLPSSLTLSDSSGGAQASASGQPTITDASDFECPQVAVRTGTSTLTIGDKPGTEPESPLSLKYQGSITNTARECRFSAGIVTMKVGIEGRIITGPAGGPGQVDVPIRLAVVHEGPQPKVVLSKLTRLSVAVVENSAGASFTHIDSEVSFPMPRPAGNIDSYIVYVGYDQQAMAPEKKKPSARSRPRR
ncbi:MAG: hypothetical protein AB7O50_04410 [Pseudolabrys sp.]